MVNVDEIAPGIQGTDINVEVYYDVDSDVKKKDQVIILSFFNADDDSSEDVIECLKNLWNIPHQYKDHIQIVLVYPLKVPSKANVKSWVAGVPGGAVTFPVIYGEDGEMIWDEYMAGMDPGDSSSTTRPHTFIIGRYTSSNGGGDRTIKESYSRTDHPLCEDLRGTLLDFIYERDPIDLEMVMDVSGSMNSISPSNPNDFADLSRTYVSSSVERAFIKGLIPLLSPKVPSAIAALERISPFFAVSAGVRLACHRQPGRK